MDTTIHRCGARSMNDLPAAGPATFEDLRHVSGIGEKQLAAAIKRGEMPAKKIGGKYYSRWEWINAWLTGQPGFWSDKPAQTDQRS